MSGEGRVTTAASYVVIIAAALVTAAVLGPIVYDTVRSPGGGDGTVAVIDIRGQTTDANVNAIRQSLREARQNDSIKAVVLRVDSPGGPADASEELYLAVNRTSREMPVVAYVEGSAASGGYLGVVAADEIYVKPSSVVGSVGVTVQAPLSAIESVERRQEAFVRSGPDKAQITRDGIRENLELLQRAFVDTVLAHRADELTLSREEVANGDTYLGPVAVQNGFADGVGDSQTAIQRAAALSGGISGDDYDVEYTSGVRAEVNVVVLQEDVERVEGDVIYVDRSDETTDQFTEPVRYYTIWGVPQSNASYREVPTDE